MKRKFVQIAALALAAVLLVLSGGVAKVSAAPAGTGGRVILVGLHHDGPYGTGSVEGLNLQNEAGSGFQFGYYDSANRFVSLGYTSQTAVSVVETMNVWYGSYGGYLSYHTAVQSNVAVGEYHLQLPGTYASFQEALGVASRYPGGFAACIGGVYYARVGCYTTSAQALAAGIPGELCWTSEYGVNVVATGTSNILFQYDDRGAGSGLGVEPIQAGNERCSTWSKNNQYPGGFRFERINGGRLTVVNVVTFEDYIEGVVSTEMSDSWPVEALKAQAVAARSYAATLEAGTHSSTHFDICDGPHCQAYSGFTAAGSNTRAAVEQTAGLGVLYNGSPAQTFYYSSNGGASESVSNVWGSNQSLYPYLVGKEDPYEASSGVSNYWERTFTSAQIISRVLSGYNVNGSIVSASISSYTDAGNPKTITFTSSGGNSYTVSSYKAFNGLGLPSFRFGFAGGSGASQPAPAAPSVNVTVNGSAPVSGASGLYAIDGNGSLSVLGEDVYVMTDSGAALLGQGGGQSAGQGYPGGEWADSGWASNGSLTFAGRGWGHNIGLSQFGAKAMAQLGYTYLEILQFYYTGIAVGYM